MPKLDEYLQAKEASEYLGVCPKTLRNWEATGRIVVLRHPINNYRLYRRSDLDRLIEQIEASGVLPTGFKRYAPRKRKPR